MTKMELRKVVLSLKAATDRVHKLYELDVDLINYTDEFYYVIGVLLKNVYTKESLEWFDWYCYENDYGRGELTATDENNEPICRDICGLYELLKVK